MKKARALLLGGVLVFLTAALIFLLVSETRLIAPEPLEPITPLAPIVSAAPIAEAPDPDAEKKRLIAELLGGRVEPDKLFALIRDPELPLETRLILAELFGECPDARAALGRAIHLLGVLRREDPAEAALRSRVIYSLGRFTRLERARFKLVEHLRPPTPGAERVAAVRALEIKPGPWCRPYLKRIIADDKDPELLGEARRILSIIKARFGSS